VVTWNIRGGVGLDGRFDIARIIRVLKRHEPDLVALQEVDSRRGGAGGEHPFVALRDALGEHGVEAKSITSADGEYGQLLISRWPLDNIHIHDISFPRCEPRRVIEADVACPYGRFRMIATHLGLSFKERREQSHKLIEAATRAPGMTVMAGDFNDWLWRGSVQNQIVRVLPARTWHRSFPSIFPLIRLDRIYCRPYAAMTRSWTDHSARRVSDHLPVFAEIAVSSSPLPLRERSDALEQRESASG
jgi:endonuclease/exonuclease/phosphatase family metal-dependent hydrolase